MYKQQIKSVSDLEADTQAILNKLEELEELSAVSEDEDPAEPEVEQTIAPVEEAQEPISSLGSQRAAVPDPVEVEEVAEPEPVTVAEPEPPKVVLPEKP